MLLDDDIDEIVDGIEVLPPTADDINVEPDIVDVVELVAEDMVVIKASDDLFRTIWQFLDISPPAVISRSKLFVKLLIGFISRASAPLKNDP